MQTQITPPTPPNGQNGHTMITTVEGKLVQDTTELPTRTEVADYLGCSVSSVRRYERSGKLHPIVDAEGTHRFMWPEVQLLKSTDHETAQQIEAQPSPKDVLAGVELSIVTKLLGLITNPREKIDRMLLEIVDRQQRRIAELEGKLIEALTAKEAALSQQAERDLVASTISKEEAVKADILQRLASKVDVLFSGGGKGGTPFLHSLSVEKLEEMANLENAAQYWGEPQLKAILEALERAKTLEQKKGQ